MSSRFRYQVHPIERTFEQCAQTISLCVIETRPGAGNNDLPLRTEPGFRQRLHRTNGADAGCEPAELDAGSHARHARLNAWERKSERMASVIDTQSGVRGSSLSWRTGMARTRSPKNANSAVRSDGSRRWFMYVFATRVIRTAAGAIASAMGLLPSQSAPST